jgi:hypothetical protein
MSTLHLIGVECLAGLRPGPVSAETAQRILTRLETRAARAARATPGWADLMATAHATGRTVTIVSNDSSAAAGTNKLPDYAVQYYIDGLASSPRRCTAASSSTTRLWRHRRAERGAQESNCQYLWIKICRRLRRSTVLRLPVMDLGFPS